MILLLTVAIATVVMGSEHSSSMEVRLKQGVIQGAKDDFKGHVYYTFKSIPYTKPPVGPLRFQDPQAAPAWNGVRNGSMPIPKCPQTNLLKLNEIVGQEDCLYLNVYTPTLDPSSLPVMVYIHGGGFIFGAAEDEYTSSSPLMQKNVVVVSINYRLGALGFLSTGDNVLPGNLGLKDQTMALRWVQDNIREFGGDPNKVTIFGVSAGGMSVHYHILSPSSAGLFQRAILQSGTALMPSAINHSAREGAIKLSKALNCSGEESEELLACFNETALYDLVSLPMTLVEWLTLPFVLGPCVDGTFLPRHPAALLKEGQYNQVDLMSGITKDDGNVFTIGLFIESGKKALEETNNNFTKVAPIMMWTQKEEDPLFLARHMILKDLSYNRAFNITREDERALTKIFSERYFTAPNIQTIEFHAKDPNTKTYMYQFDHLLEKSLMSLFFNTTQDRPMAGHGDDMLYFMTLNNQLGLKIHQQDFHMQDIIITLWTNFAATGNPTINGSLGFRWLPVTPEGPLHYLSLTTTPAMHTVDEKIREFWTSLPLKTNKQLYPERFLEE